MVLLRALTRVLEVLLMIALGLVCLGIAMYCLDGLVSLGSVRPDRLLHLPTFRDHVGHFLAQIAAAGSTAALALAGGVVAVLLGLLVLIGTLRSSKERLVILRSSGNDGTLAARPGTVRTMAQALAEQAGGATSIQRPRIKLGRRGTRGHISVVATRTRTSDANDVQTEITNQLQPLIEPFNLKPRVRVHEGERGNRVQ
jgi:hypothetical protein